ncbi:ABC transporter substrate-binding protein [Acetivibrio ethanolgignens]|uniref:ABC transporter substrate-binding protein n=1 Tax=Acetivibrio ethanolgignens TaxID=290052 RepID=A0A0V8QFM3_9FIRM|nr:ABC transporter substrate-binding protein [Acetivibrio ethanolgignens]KSV59030.1 ABC transporter substrate-binding protein [Acetivibrio ethanolgignens]
MKKKLLSAVLTTALVISCLSGCGETEKEEGSSERNSGETIQIAVAGPMTGDNAEYGIGFANAAELMAKEWNEKGGVLGKQIEIVKFDDKNTSEEATTIAQKIVSDKKVAGVIGHFASGVCMTAAPIYQENQIIEISPSSSHADYSGIGDYIFRNNTVIAKEGAASVDIAINDLEKKNIGIISIMTDWGTNTAEIVKGLIADSGDAEAKVVAHEEVMEGSDDYTSAITKLDEAGADVVICCGMYNLVAPVAKQYKQINPEIEIVAFSNAYSQQLIELGGEAVEGVRFPVIFFSESEDENVRNYVEAYTAEYGSAPSALTSQAYDSVGMLLTAIEETGSTDSEVVKAKLYEIEYEGVTGFTKFDSIGDVDKEFVKVTIQNGKFVKMN